MTAQLKRSPLWLLTAILCVVLGLGACSSRGSETTDEGDPEPTVGSDASDFEAPSVDQTLAFTQPVEPFETDVVAVVDGGRIDVLDIVVERRYWFVRRRAMTQKLTRLAALVTLAVVAVACGGAVEESDVINAAEPAEVVGQACDRDGLVGEWVSARAARTEPLDPNDGIGDEGGSGVVVLTLSNVDAQLLSFDTVEVFAQWSCSNSEILVVVGSEERPLAQVNSDGTLLVGQWVLTKADG